MDFKSALCKGTEHGIFLTAITTLILVGCGGGGGGGSSSSLTATLTSTTIVPYKGPFLSGTVSLTDANGNPVKLLNGTGVIAASGVASISYNSNVTYPLFISVSGVYVNEVTGLTESTGSTPLRGIIPIDPTSAFSTGIGVNGITDIAVQLLAKQTPTLTGISSTSALYAIAETASGVLGLSVSQALSPPVFNSQGQTTDTTTLQLAALSVIASTQGTGSNLLSQMQNMGSQVIAASAVNVVIPASVLQSAASAVVGGSSNLLPPGSAPVSFPPGYYPSVSSPLLHCTNCIATYTADVTVTGLPASTNLVLQIDQYRPDFTSDGTRQITVSNNGQLLIGSIPLLDSFQISNLIQPKGTYCVFPYVKPYLSGFGSWLGGITTGNQIICQPPTITMPLFMGVNIGTPVDFSYLFPEYDSNGAPVIGTNPGNLLYYGTNKTFTPIPGINGSASYDPTGFITGNTSGAVTLTVSDPLTGATGSGIFYIGPWHFSGTFNTTGLEGNSTGTIIATNVPDSGSFSGTLDLFSPNRTDIYGGFIASTGSASSVLSTTLITSPMLGSFAVPNGTLNNSMINISSGSSVYDCHAVIWQTGELAGQSGVLVSNGTGSMGDGFILPGGNSYSGTSGVCSVTVSP